MENNKYCVHLASMSPAFKTECYTDMSNTCFLHHKHLFLDYQQFSEK